MSSESRFVPFEGELDPPQEFVPFDGELDAPPERRAPRTIDIPARQRVEGPGLLERMAASGVNFGGGMLNSLLAGFQRTTPITQSIDGAQTMRPLGPLVKSDAATGYSVGDTNLDFNPDRHVVLLEDGKPQVFERNTGSEEGLAPSMGRVLGTGTLTQPVTRIPGGQIPRTTMQQSLDDFAKIGVDPRVATASQNFATRAADRVLRSVPLGGSPILAAEGRELGQLRQASQSIAEQLGMVRHPDALGRDIQSGLTAAAKDRFQGRFASRAAELFNDIKIAPDMAIDPAATIQVLDDPRVRNNPELAKILGSPEFQRVSKAIYEGGLTWSDAKALRSWVGENTGFGGVTPQGASNADMKRLYGALSNDLRVAAASQGPEMGRAFDRANRYYAAGSKEFDVTLAPILNADTSEKAVQAIEAATRANTGNMAALQGVRRNLDPGTWGDVRATMIERMGRPTPGAAGATGVPGVDDAFSPGTFLTNWNKMSPRARAIMFDGPQKDAIDALARVSDRIKQVNRGTNVSNSAQGVIGAGIGTGLFTGLADPTVLLTTIASVGGSGLTAAVLASPRFTRWLANGSGIKTPTQMTSYIARLAAITKAEPELEPARAAIESALNQDQ
jgi:hypothetical protein